MSQKKINKSEKNILNEESSAYGFAHKSETEKLKEDIFRSDKEKFLLFTQMLRRNAMLKKATVTTPRTK
jgi:hypothetical protein